MIHFNQEIHPRSPQNSDKFVKFSVCQLVVSLDSSLLLYGVINLIVLYFPQKVFCLIYFLDGGLFFKSLHPGNEV